MSPSSARFLLEAWLPLEFKDMLEDLELHFGSSDLAIAEAIRALHAQLFSRGIRHADAVATLLAAARHQSTLARMPAPGTAMTPTQTVVATAVQASAPMHTLAPARTRPEPEIRRRRAASSSTAPLDLSAAIGKKKPSEGSDSDSDSKPERPPLEETMDAMIWADE